MSWLDTERRQECWCSLLPVSYDNNCFFSFNFDNTQSRGVLCQLYRDFHSIWSAVHRGLRVISFLVISPIHSLYITYFLLSNMLIGTFITYFLSIDMSTTCRLCWPLLTYMQHTCSRLCYLILWFDIFLYYIRNCFHTGQDSPLGTGQRHLCDKRISFIPHCIITLSLCLELLSALRDCSPSPRVSTTNWRPWSAISGAYSRAGSIYRLANLSDSTCARSFPWLAFLA